MLAAMTQGPISALAMMMELTGHARLFALPMLVAIVIATALARSIEPRSVYEARLSEEHVAARLRMRNAHPHGAATPGGG
jgi:chloride channel protein, CIC family